MDLAANSLDAYVLFSAPRDLEPTGRPGHAPKPPRQRKPPIGWLVAAFYGLLIGAFMLGVTAAGRPLEVLRCSGLGLTVTVGLQAFLLHRAKPSLRAVRVAQALTTPALALMISGIGGIARLS